jgi:hypothetical protein
MPAPRAFRTLRGARRAAALPLASWRALGRVVPTVVAVRLALWALPYRTVLRVFEPPTRPGPTRSAAYALATLQVADWVGRTTLGDRPCLTQAIAARWLLGRAGFPAELKLGARRDAGQFLAHAWLEIDGRVVLGGAASPTTYTALRSVSEPLSAAA